MPSGDCRLRRVGDRPFMIMSSHGFGPWNDPSWSGFWQERAYIGAFFDLHLRGRASELLDHASPDFPDIQFLGR